MSSRLVLITSVLITGIAAMMLFTWEPGVGDHPRRLPHPPPQLDSSSGASGAESPLQSPAITMTPQGASSQEAPTDLIGSANTGPVIADQWVAPPEELLRQGRKLARLAGLPRNRAIEILNLFKSEQAWSKAGIAIAEANESLSAVAARLQHEATKYARPMAHDPTNMGMGPKDVAPPDFIVVNFMIGDNAAGIKKRFAIDPMNSNPTVAQLWGTRDSRRRDLLGRLERIIQDQ